MKNIYTSLNEYGKLQQPCFFIINFEGNQGEIYPLEEIDNTDISFDFSGIKNHSNDINKIDLSPKYIDFETFEKEFNQVIEQLHKGNSFLTNLTFATPIQAVNLEEIYQNVNAKYKILYKKQWVCFSPETFVKINSHNQIATYPMKGTIDANIPNAEQVLLQNEKETAEHYTIVDLLRNDLSKVAKNVTVSRFRYLEKIHRSKGDILQASSEIIGQLPDNWQANLGDILQALLPAGSISGAPKDKTIEIIKNVENYNRNFYTGIAGVFDGYSLDSCVLIRFIEQEGNNFYYKSGGGITAQSNVIDEYNEIKQKIYLPY